MKVECIVEKCFRRGSKHCEKCKHNTKRNALVDGFEQCNDNDLKDVRMINGRYTTTLVGTAEQGGLKCPACGYLNNAYAFHDEGECFNCGLPLTTKRL